MLDRINKSHVYISLVLILLLMVLLLKLFLLVFLSFFNRYQKTIFFKNINNIDLYNSGTKQVFDYHISNSGIQISANYNLSSFDTSPIKIGNSTYVIDTSLTNGANSVDVGMVTYYLGQSFNNGLSSPEINTKSGEIVYVDNRPSVTRSSQQREDIKIILEF